MGWSRGTRPAQNTAPKPAHRANGRSSSKARKVSMSDKSRKDAYANSSPLTGDTPLAPFKKGDYDRDVLHFTRDVDRDPNNAIAYENRGFAHYLNDDYDLASRDYNEAIKLASEHARA